MHDFHNPVRITFESGALDLLGDAVGARDAVLITTPGMVRRGVADRIGSALGDRLVGSFTDVEPNPTISSCTQANDALRDLRADVLIALGGGSSIDTAKAVAAQRAGGASDGWLAAHLRQKAPFPDPFAPPAIIAVPTTAGTGSEVTMWGTIWDDRTAGKHSISHPALYPERALVDPLLGLSVPRETTVASALDALSHAMESIWNRGCNPVSDALAMRAISIIPRVLPRAVEAPDDVDARTALASAALVAGMAIASTRTALAHSISYPLTAELGVPHGIACSFTLPELLRSVDGERPDRSALVLTALGVGSADEANEQLRQLLASVGSDDVLRRHVPDVTALRQIRSGFIAPGRAENFVLDVDQAWAEALVERAYLSTGSGVSAARSRGGRGA